jgi:DNA-binding MarR family transcriptional regulator
VSGDDDTTRWRVRPREHDRWTGRGAPDRTGRNPGDGPGGAGDHAGGYGEDHAAGYAERIEALEAVARESRRLAEQADRLVDALAARAGLDPAAFRCLHLLVRQGPMPVHRLAARAGLDPGMTRDVAGALERAGLVRWGRDDVGREVVRADETACRERIAPAVRELREAWQGLTGHGCDDLAVVAVLLAQGRRLTELVPTLG